MATGSSVESKASFTLRMVALPTRPSAMIWWTFAANFFSSGVSASDMRKLRARSRFKMMASLPAPAAVEGSSVSTLGVVADWKPPLFLSSSG